MNLLKIMCQINFIPSANGFRSVLRLIPLFIAFSLPPTASAEWPTIDELVGRIQESYEITQDIRATFIQDITIKSLKKTEREEVPSTSRSRA